MSSGYDYTTLGESDGPDRCNQSLKCRQFHDLPHRTDLNGNSECCCCNPCTHLRDRSTELREDDSPVLPQLEFPFVFAPIQTSVASLNCCRCVPRILLLHFYPENPGNPCCQEIVSPLFHNPAGGSGPWSETTPRVSIYTGSLYDVTVHVAVGRIGPETETYWVKVTIDDDPTGTLSARNSDSDGTVTIEPAIHGMAPGSYINLEWSGGARYGMIVSDVSGYDITAAGGIGDELPALGTDEITVVHIQQESFPRCGWHIVGEKDSQRIFDRMYLFDSGLHDYGSAYYDDYAYGYEEYGDATCFEPPPVGAIAYGIKPIEGCEGRIVLETVEKSRVPFVQDGDVKAFVDKRHPEDFPDCLDAYGNLDIDDANCHPSLIDLCGDCAVDQYGETVTPDCVNVNGVVYLEDGTENGQPVYVNGDRNLYWSGSQWVLVEFDAYGETEIATGPETEDCPVGLYRFADDYTDDYSDYSYDYSYDDYVYDDGTCFCVTLCDVTDIVQCGCISQVPSRICVRGPRYEGIEAVPVPFASFAWFEDWMTAPGEDPWLVKRGWKYDNPDTDKTEYVLLESESPDILVDGDAWSLSFGDHTFGDSAWPYWRGILDVQDAYVYRGAGYWAILRGGNEIASGPTTLLPYGDYTEYAFPYRTFVVSQPPSTDKCYLRPRFVENNETWAVAEWWAPQEITDRGRGDWLLEEFTSIEGGRLQIVGGFCKHWNYWCGYCRCVPTSLCVLYWDTSTYQSFTVTWDADTKSWTNGNGFALALRRNGSLGSHTNPALKYDDCVVVPEIDGYTPSSGKPYSLYDCGEESVRRQFDPDTDFVVIDYADQGRTIYATSLRPECVPAPCPGVTPCHAKCGGNPPVLYATVRQYPAFTPPEPVPEPYVYEVELFLTFGSGGLGDCEYVGYLPPWSGNGHDCCGVRAVLKDGVFNWRPIVYDCDDNSQEPPNAGLTLDESCEPYYATAGDPENPGSNYLHGYGWKCLDPQQSEWMDTAVEITE